MNSIDQLSRKQLAQISTKKLIKPFPSSMITFKMETPNEITLSNPPLEIIQAPHEQLFIPSHKDLDTPKTLSIIDDLLTSNINDWPSLHNNNPGIQQIIESLEENTNPDSSPLDFSLEFHTWSTKPHNGLLISKPFIDCQFSPIKMSPSSSIEDFEPIPRGLIPLPDILLNVPFYYESFKFYMDSTTSILTPADNSIYIDNPFKIVLPKLAMANDGLMSILVAFGVWHKAALDGDITKDSLVESLIDRTLKELFKLLSNSTTSTSDLTLALVMLLSSFTVFTLKNNFHWKIHMKGAKQIFLNRGYDKPFNKLLVDTNYTQSSNSMRPKLLYFLIRWFAYIDIFTDLSSPLIPSIDDINQAKIDNLNSLAIPTYDTNKMDYDFNNVPGSLISLESHENIDYMLGFNLKIIPIFSHLSSLIKCVNILNEIGLPSPPSVNETALIIQQQLNHFQFTMFVPNTTPNFKSINHLIASNQCFLYMGTLQLYTRVLKIDRSSDLIQSICDKMKVLIENYIDTTPNSITLILPLFIAGCESLNEKLRTFYLSKLIDLKIKGAINADCAMELMQISWDTSNNWWEVMTLLNKNVVFI